jgi:hypothetical protein
MTFLDSHIQLARLFSPSGLSYVYHRASTQIGTSYPVPHWFDKEMIMGMHLTGILRDAS